MECRCNHLIIYLLKTSIAIAFLIHECTSLNSNDSIIFRHERIGGYDGTFNLTLNLKQFNESAEVSGDQTNIKWGNTTEYRIISFNKYCDIHSFTSKERQPLVVQFDISSIHLYGGGEQIRQKLLVEQNTLQNYSFVSKDLDKQEFLEPFWLTTSGFYIYVDETVPLFISLNRTTFTLSANIQLPYIRTQNTETVLRFQICKFKNAREAHENAIATLFDRPTTVPDSLMVDYPIWSTWAEYKANINESTVLEFAENIAKRNLKGSQIEIDDKWETCYGSLLIDEKKFPDMKGLVNKLKNMGFRVTVWIHPFVNLDCEPFHQYGINENYFTKSQNDSVVTSWWNGNTSCIDFTNPMATRWWQYRVEDLRRYGIDSFKFAAGKCSSLPYYYEMRDDHPETWLKSYIEAASFFGPSIEVGSGRRMQKHGTFTHMVTSWKISMKTIIPTLLFMNLIGYRFAMPDMIGGNQYKGEATDKEMFIRWLQANVFMPTMQFSIPPWKFGEDMIPIVQKYIDLHKKFSPLINSLMNKTVRTGKPVNLPIWYLDPENPEAQVIDTEFLLGEDLLVAPVLEMGMTTRDIYIPKGSWKDENNQLKDHINGPIWLKNYSADLNTLPYFTRLKHYDDTPNTSDTPVTTDTPKVASGHTLSKLPLLLAALLILIVCTRFSDYVFSFVSCRFLQSNHK